MHFRKSRAPGDVLDNEGKATITNMGVQDLQNIIQRQRGINKRRVTGLRTREDVRKKQISHASFDHFNKMNQHGVPELVIQNSPEPKRKPSKLSILFNIFSYEYDRIIQAIR